MFVFKGFGSDQDLHGCENRENQKAIKSPLLFCMTIMTHLL